MAALGGKSIRGGFGDFSAADGDDAVRSRRVYGLLGRLGIVDRVKQGARDVLDDAGDARLALLVFTFGMMFGERYMTSAARPG